MKLKGDSRLSKEKAGATMADVAREAGVALGTVSRVVNGQQVGPFSMPQLTQLAQNGQLTQQSLVWKQGMAGWEQAGSVAELSSLFAPSTPGNGATPPPMPNP